MNTLSSTSVVYCEKVAITLCQPGCIVCCTSGVPSGANVKLSSSVPWSRPWKVVALVSTVALPHEKTSALPLPVRYTPCVSRIPNGRPHASQIRESTPDSCEPILTVEQPMPSASRRGMAGVCGGMGGTWDGATREDGGTAHLSGAGRTQVVVVDEPLLAVHEHRVEVA
eukprot:283100-Prymnesium_polylepis.2